MVLYASIYCIKRLWKDLIIKWNTKITLKHINIVCRSGINIIPP